MVIEILSWMDNDIVPRYPSEEGTWCTNRILCERVWHPTAYIACQLYSGYITWLSIDVYAVLTWSPQNLTHRLWAARRGRCWRGRGTGPGLAPSSSVLLPPADAAAGFHAERDHSELMRAQSYSHLMDQGDSLNWWSKTKKWCVTIRPVTAYLSNWQRMKLHNTF